MERDSKVATRTEAKEGVGEASSDKRGGKRRTLAWSFSEIFPLICSFSWPSIFEERGIKTHRKKTNKKKEEKTNLGTKLVQ